MWAIEVRLVGLPNMVRCQDVALYATSASLLIASASVDRRAADGRMASKGGVPIGCRWVGAFMAMAAGGGGSGGGGTWSCRGWRLDDDERPTADGPGAPFIIIISIARCHFCL